MAETFPDWWVTTLPFWDDPYATWDRVTLGDVTLPGVCSVSGSVKRDVEVKKAKGADGATVKDNGYRPAPVTIIWRVSTQEEWERLQDALAVIHPRDKGGERQPVAIVHPAPNLLGVSHVYVKEISFPQVTNTKEIEIRISAIEWVEEPKKPKQGAGFGAGGPGYGNLDDVVRDEEEALIDALHDEAERQAWAAEQEQQEEEAWPYGDAPEEPWNPDSLVDEMIDNFEDGLEADDEFEEAA